MTQIIVGAITPDAASLTSSIPRPRAPEPSIPSPQPQAAPAASDAAARSHRRLVIGPAIAFDTALSIGLAIAMTTLGGLSVGVAVAAATCWVLVSLASGHYRQRALGEGRSRRFRLVLGTGVRASVLLLAASPWLGALGPIALAQLVAVLSAASAVHLMVGVRRHRPRLVLAGRPRDVREAMLELQLTDSHEIVAVCLTRRSKVPFGDLPAYVGFDSSSRVAEQHQADALVLLPGARLTTTEIRQLHWALTGVGTELCVGTGLLDVTPTRTHVFATGGLTLVRAVPPPLRGPCTWVKAGTEWAAAAVGLAFLLPVLVVVGLLVRLESPGPAIYRQQRVGRDGHPFTMYKFRSMCTSAESERAHLLASNEADGVLFKIQQDPRVTRLGRWLRRTSVDEVPQLWNVLRGEMSLVGPRPALPDEVARYDADPRRRLVVKPGMTGLWQVSGRSDLSWAESVRLDLRYVENWSLRLDALILLRTVRAVLGRRGAY